MVYMLHNISLACTPGQMRKTCKILLFYVTLLDHCQLLGSLMLQDQEDEELTITVLWANSTDYKLIIFSYFSPKNRN